MVNRMSKTVTFIYPFDPVGEKVGGVETFIRGFIKFAPPDFNIELIGITTSLSERSVNVWKWINIGTTKFRFYPILHEIDENKKAYIPLSLRFTLALARVDLDVSRRVLIFNRLEPCLAFIRSNHRKIGFVHNDIQKQMMQGSDSLWKYMPRFYFFLERKILGSLDRVYTVNTATLDFYNQTYPEISHKVRFIPTWVDEEVFSVTEENKMSIRRELAPICKTPPENTWLLFVGRLQEQKAPLKLVESFYEYTKVDNKSCLLVVGEGNLKKAMSRKAKELGILSCIRFLGYRTQKQLARFYHAADVLVLTSNYEGMPRCCLEALGSGLPVVSTAVGEVHRVIRNNFSGEIVENSSATTIARAIDKIVRNPHTYKKANCLSSISEYTPRNVLKEVFTKIARYAV
jgi:glycosyltransferase involved in cell wall biosynthesis